MITEQEVKEIIETIIQNEGLQYEDHWDSLCHINILIALDQKLNGGVAKISDIQTANSACAIIEKLKEHHLIG